jgi:hypothetical protein
MPDPTAFEVAKFGYGEVLDATKHQDDKIGRVLVAIAFLTAGALVFAKPETLNTVYRVGNYEYRLTAILLGVFLFFDLASVTLFILTVTTPLTYPGTVTGGRSNSHIYFLSIAGTNEDDWDKMWEMPGNNIHKDVKGELINEIRNIAKRTSQKYKRSRAASAFFLASILYLIPMIVLGLDTLSRKQGTETVTLDWGPFHRYLVATSVAAIVLIFMLWASAHAHAAIDKQVAPDKQKSRRRSSLLVLSAAYPFFVGACIVSDGRQSVDASRWIESGWVEVAGAGIVVTWAVWRLYAATSQREEGWKRRGPWIAGLVGLSLTIAAVLAVADRRPDLQLLVAMIAATLVLADNWIRLPLAAQD